MKENMDCWHCENLHSSSSIGAPVLPLLHNRRNTPDSFWKHPRGERLKEPLRETRHVSYQRPQLAPPFFPPHSAVAISAEEGASRRCPAWAATHSPVHQLTRQTHCDTVSVVFDRRPRPPRPPKTATMVAAPIQNVTELLPRGHTTSCWRWLSHSQPVAPLISCFLPTNVTHA